MKKTQGILFLLAFVLIGSVATTPIYGRVVSAITGKAPSDIGIQQQTDGCDDEDDDDDEHNE